MTFLGAAGSFVTSTAGFFSVPGGKTNGTFGQDPLWPLIPSYTDQMLYGQQELLPRI